MACPVCDHTMQRFGTEDFPTFWCPRCGTLKMMARDFMATSGHEEVESPAWMKWAEKLHSCRATVALIKAGGPPDKADQKILFLAEAQEAENVEWLKFCTAPAIGALDAGWQKAVRDLFRLAFQAGWKFGVEKAFEIGEPST